MLPRLNRSAASVKRFLSFQCNRLLGRYQRKVWLIGDGRSGTTWIADLIRYRRRYREMFEPFHPGRSCGMGFLQRHEYVRPDVEHEQLESAAAAVFAGRHFGGRVDGGNTGFWHDGLLVKDVYANLFARWVKLRHPDIRIVLLLRNPLAVAASKVRTGDASWQIDPLNVFAQNALREDYLEPFTDVIAAASRSGDPVERYVTLWAMLYYVPLLQFRSDDLHVVFYEDAVRRRDETMAALQQFIDPQAPVVRVPDRIAERPSSTTAESSSVTADCSPIYAWREHVTDEQVARSREVLESFGMEAIYDDQGLPDHDAVEELLDRNDPATHGVVMTGG